jgi:hemin uptake protein HemP
MATTAGRTAMNQNRSDRPVTTDARADAEVDGPDSVRNCHPEGAATFDFDELAGSANCIHIRFGPNLYSLRKTRTGRLVLNK